MEKKYPSLKLDIPKEIKNQISSIEADVKELGENKNSKSDYTINLVDKNKSIIKELPNFGIVYTDNNKHKINYKKFIAYCDFKNIPRKTSNLIVNDLSIIKYKQNPTNIFKLKFINNDEFDFEDNEDEIISDFNKNTINKLNKEDLDDNKLESIKTSEFRITISNIETSDSNDKLDEFEDEDETVDFWN